MIRRLFRVLEVTALLFLVGLAIILLPTFFDPAFKVTNNSNEPVFVVAQWRNQSMEIGTIEPASTHEFSVDDEAAMTFLVRYPDRGEVHSEPVYFSRGLTVIADIMQHTVEVTYDHER